MNRIDYACPLEQTRRTPWQRLSDLGLAIVCTAAAAAIGLMCAGWRPL
jgi:hypothetical protein